ncbi:putative ATP-dependent kinase TDA10 [Psilocybe cubensis]|uniref:P-loop containing nucleoside triphosphate hydrolase protein n=2 Tax=Psilocybe cubensis TaxID=181762 RepID=A0A8H7Y5E4_PSICU|nr:putative ATP-dependent kinase TDA10 [Psilocybe cubensis]KAH9485522.1 putative ATP-dependent kinase TDA10 [Psilocybe cubensis]
MTALNLIAEYVLRKLSQHRPLFVAIQGPQGSGKSYLATHVQSLLQKPPHSLRVAVLSIDDLYLPHKDLVLLAAANSDNPLLNGRGQPGTHDVDLGVQILSALKTGNSTIELPRFDKSLHSGEGDRLPVDGTGTIVVQPPRIDVVIFEGWCVGFSPISEQEILSRWRGVWDSERRKLNRGLDNICRPADLKIINEYLKQYSRLWSFFDIFVQLKPEEPPFSHVSRYEVVYKWRLDQEHNMKSRNGGKGMSDTAVQSFVDRYIPGYVFFGDFPPLRHEENLEGTSIQAVSGLSIVLDEARNVIASSTF